VAFQALYSRQQREIELFMLPRCGLHPNSTGVPGYVWLDLFTGSKDCFPVLPLSVPG
jgi:hypothetical protein